MMEKNMI